VDLPASPNFLEVEARMNISETLIVGGIPANNTKYYYYVNGTAIPFPGTNPQLHDGVNNNVTKVTVERLTASGGSDFLTLDDLKVDFCVPTCNDPVFDVRTSVNEINPDGMVGDRDFDAFSACVTGPNIPQVTPTFECRCMDVNGDGAIDMADFAVFQRCYSGAFADDPACDDNP